MGITSYLAANHVRQMHRPTGPRRPVSVIGHAGGSFAVVACCPRRLPATTTTASSAPPPPPPPPPPSEFAGARLRGRRWRLGLLRLGPAATGGVVRSAGWIAPGKIVGEPPPSWTSRIGTTCQTTLQRDAGLFPLLRLQRRFRRPVADRFDLHLHALLACLRRFVQLPS